MLKCATCGKPMNIPEPGKDPLDIMAANVEPAKAWCSDDCYDKREIALKVMPPTLDRQDWLAMREDYKTGDPVGTGATEDEAIRDVLRQL